VVQLNAREAQREGRAISKLQAEQSMVGSLRANGECEVPEFPKRRPVSVYRLLSEVRFEGCF
jgi:hypothetical protein